MPTYIPDRMFFVEQKIARRGPAETTGRPPLLPIIVISSALLLTVFEGAVRKWFLGGIMGPASYAMYLSKDFAFVFLLVCRARYLPQKPTQFFQRYLIIAIVLIIAGATTSAVQGISPVGAMLTLRA